jgi:surface antigen
MRSKARRGLLWGAFGAALLLAWSRPAPAANCALYARAETGVYLYGAAGGWWDEAAGRYQRGQSPALGAILVFKRSGYTPSGHVAVVSGVVSSREILIDHANWYRGRVSRGMSAIDTSPNNDWTSVAVRDLRSGAYGRRSPTYGFVYPTTGARQLVAAQTIVGYDSDLADGRPPARWGSPGRFVHVALTTDDRHRRGQKSSTGHATRRKTAPAHASHGASHVRSHSTASAKTKAGEAKRARG